MAHTGETGGFLKGDPDLCRVPSTVAAVEKERRFPSTLAFTLRGVRGHHSEGVSTVGTKETIPRTSVYAIQCNFGSCVALGLPVLLASHTSAWDLE